MHGLRDIILQQSELQSVITGIREGLREQLVAGLSGSVRALFTAAMAEHTNKSVVIVTHNLLQAQKLHEDLLQIIDENQLFLYPANELIASEMGIASPELKAQRIETLNHMVSGRQGVFVVPMAGLRKVLPPPSLWKRYQINLKVGSELHLEDTLERLIQMGYNRTDMVSAPGEFSLRGGILDIYPLTEIDPIRIELFDIEIDSIRTFSVDDQRSKEKLSEVTIGPATESPVESKHLLDAADSLEEHLSASLKKIKKDAVKELLVQNVKADIELLRNGQKPEQFFKYLQFAYKPGTSLLDYVSYNGLIVFDELSRIQEMNERLEKEEAEWFMTLLEHGEIPHDIAIAHSFNKLLAESNLPRVYLSLFLRHIPNTNPQNIANVSCKLMQNFHGQMHLLASEVERWRKNNMKVLFLAPDQERSVKLESVLRDYGIEARIAGDSESFSGIQIIEGSLNTGFELPALKLVVVTEEEIFNKKTRKARRRQKLSNAERIKSYSELSPGDYVVHVNHGIGKYLGIETLMINGVHKDYLHITYKGNDKLYVPVDQIDLVQKYVGAEGKDPKMYKLGGSEWKRVKKK